MSIYSGGPFLKQAQKLIANTYGNSFLFQRGLNRKDSYHKEGRLVTDCIYDMLVFRDIRQRMFGGKIRLLFMDDDEVPKTDLSSFYRAILSAQVIKTFSHPETSSSMTATLIYDYAHDKRVVGPPLACMEIKLTDAEKEGYTAEDLPNPRGEIKVRGHNVFVGYWNDMSTSMDKIDPDGWYSTGMIGEALPNGSLMLLGPRN
jgi:long-subunit acyl-CoA synthetase (AMP-forming)